MSAVDRNEFYDFTTNIWSEVFALSKNLATAAKMLNELYSENRKLRDEIYELKANQHKDLQNEN